MADAGVEGPQTADTVTPEDAFSSLGADDPARARSIEEAAREHDWARLAGLYALQAWWLDEEGRDALQVTRLARRAELRALSEQGVTLVGVTVADHDQRGEGETTSTLHHLGNAVDRDQLVDQIIAAITIRAVAIPVPSAAAAAAAFPRFTCHAVSP